MRQQPWASNCASLPPNISAEVFIAINEVMASPLSETTGEFIELYNFGTDPVELEGMVLSDGDTTDVITGWQGGATSIAAGQFAVIIDPDYDGAYNIATGALWLTVATSSTLGNGLAVNDPISLWIPLDMSHDTYTHTLNGGNGISSEKVEATIGDIAPNSPPRPASMATLRGASIARPSMEPTPSAERPWPSWRSWRTPLMKTKTSLSSC